MITNLQNLRKNLIKLNKNKFMIYFVFYWTIIIHVVKLFKFGPRGPDCGCKEHIHHLFQNKMKYKTKSEEKSTRD